MASTEIHIGANIKRFRELLGVKQELLARELGDDWSQVKVSLLEGKASVDPVILEQVAKALRIPVEAIKNFDEEKALNIISNTFNDNSILNGINYNPSFHPIDKLMEMMEENKKLYTALLKAQEEKIALLERLLAEKK